MPCHECGRECRVERSHTDGQHTVSADHGASGRHGRDRGPDDGLQRNRNGFGDTDVPVEEGRDRHRWCHERKLHHACRGARGRRGALHVRRDERGRGRHEHCGDTDSHPAAAGNHVFPGQPDGHPVQVAGLPLRPGGGHGPALPRRGHHLPGPRDRLRRRVRCPHQAGGRVLEAQ